MPDPVQEAVVARPRGPLRGVVAEHHAFRYRHVPPARHLGLPSPYLTVIVTLDEPLHVSQQPDVAQAPDRYDALVGGLHTRPAVIEHDGAQSGVQLALSPLGTRALLGVPAGELAGLDVHATELIGRLGAELQKRMQAATCWTERFRLLDDGLGRLVDPARRPPAEVCHAWHLLRASHGTARVADVARAVGWSERHLAARFRVEIGLTPKAAARVIRFDRARRMIPFSDGATVAATCGYADQPHLVRDFVAFTGLAPGAWLAAEVGNLQAAGAAAGRDWAPLGGGIMLGSARDDNADGPTAPGACSAYVVVDEPDALCERVRAGGAQVIMDLHDTDYGSRDFAIRDPEGNRWYFGTYRGAPRAS